MHVRLGRLGNADELSLLVEQAKARFPYVVFLPFLYANKNRGGHDLFSPEGIRAYNPDMRFAAPVFQAAFMGDGYDEAAIIRALKAILAGGMPEGATASGPAQTVASGGGGGSYVADLFPDPDGGQSAAVKFALPAAALAALWFFFKWR